ncbi:hypothetical protein VB713_13500 [Anabaena cylindrica UHCC 0172]|nr:hypothetical protein [Anabaena cylindrica UHCC 0172]
MSMFKAIIPLFGVVTIGCLSTQIPVYAQAQTSLKSFNFSNKVAVAFPITGDRDDAVANGRMRTSFTLTKKGELSAVTNTRTKVKLAGFTGAASIILVDANKRPIWASGVHSYGVDGCLIGKCQRNDNWSENVPSEIMSRVRGYAILQQHNPRWRVFDRGEQFLRWLGSNEGKATVATIASIVAMF